MALTDSDCNAEFTATLSGTEYTVGMIAKSVTPVVVKDVQMANVQSGTIPIDRGRVSNALQLTGTVLSDAYNRVKYLNDFMDGGCEIELDVDDSNLDGDYYIQNLSAFAGEGYGAMYDIDIVLERVRD